MDELETTMFICCACPHIPRTFYSSLMLVSLSPLKHIFQKLALSTALNIMFGYKECGTFPINPSEITHRQIAPSKGIRYPSPATSDQNMDADDTTLRPLFIPEKEALFRNR